MSSWTIYGKDGVAKASVKELELHDEWMAECFLTVTVKSENPVYFAVGDYIDYRDDRYTINYDPSVVKKARRGTYGEGFVYDNIKFVSVQDELVRCDFTDIVLSDNNIHYTSLPTFPFYCETADDLLDRIQANLEELYPGEWIVISPMLDRNRQRGACVGREQAFVSAYNKYIGGGSFTYEKTGVALTVDNITCWDALAKVHEDFALDFIVRGRVVIVGTAGVFTNRKFKYGKGNGLYEIELVGDSEQQVVTRLRAYGAETNLPLNYYAHKHDRMFITGTKYTYTVEGAGSPSYWYVTSIPYASIKGAIRRDDNKCKLSFGSKTIYAFFDQNVDDDSGIAYLTARFEQDGSDEEFYNAISDGDRVYIEEGIDINMWPQAYIETGGDYPALLTINRLMLPGFPDMSLLDWVQENRPELLDEGFTFSDDINRPYIDSPNVALYGIRPSSIYFDGNGDNEDIHPTIDGMEWQGHACDVIVDAQQIEDSGVLPDNATASDKRFTVTIPYAGFELDSLWQDGAAIEMKDGMCGARTLKIMQQPKKVDGGWECVCERAYDETLHLYFPYNDFQVNAGDHFVLTGIDLPDSYIEAASIRLFDAAVEALRKNHAPRVTFQPRIDEIWMQRQHDTAMASHGATESLHDTMRAGDYFSFEDEDLGIDARIIIDVLTIKENGNNGIPTYDVTLREEKVVSTIDKKIQKITSGSGGGVGGGYNSRQIGSMIEMEGSNLFLSKIEDDEAQGLIGFLKGAWFGAKQWIIDALGNANLNNVTVNGILRAFNAYINNVQSTNYTGDGMLDTGWRITNAYEGSNSKAVFDYLYVRKKALFEELEIRKLSHIGGNFCLSPASGRVWRVECYGSFSYDQNGNIVVDREDLIGYDEKTVPYTLGGRLLKLFSRLVGRTGDDTAWVLSRKKLVPRSLTQEDAGRVKLIRVFMFTDDGTTQTMLNWTKGAQARCQTFNIEEQMDHISGGESDNPDVSYWTGEKVQNHYWWRLVQGTGKGLCDDGKEHYYIDFLENQPNQRTHSDVGSDIPSVGDEFGQFGHRTRSDQSNVIMIETANDDSPSIKFYHGINSWNLNGKRPVIISPTLVEMRSSIFRWITSYGDNVGQVTKRGLWTGIEREEMPGANIKYTEDTVYNDMVRKCFPGDVVSHGGTMWRCIVASGSHKEDANGRWLTQAEVDAMTLDEQIALREVENYTIQEPSANATDWIEYADEAIAPYIKFSEALVAVPCEKDRRATDSVSKTITARLMVTNLEATVSSMSIEGADSHVFRSGNSIVVSIPRNAAVTNKDYTVTIEGDYNGTHYIATDKISVYAVIRGNDAYEVHTSPSQWTWNQEGASMTTEEIIAAIDEGTELTFNIMIDGVELLPDGSMGNSCAQITVMNGGQAMPFVINGVTTSDQHIGTAYNNRTGRVWVTSVPNTLETGWVDVAITYGDNASLTLRIPFYCNLLGTWREQIIGDTQVVIANRTRYLDDRYTSFHAEYVQSSQENSAKFTAINGILGENGEKVVSSVDFANYQQTASQNLSQLETRMNQSVDGKLGSYVTTSTFNQRASAIELSVTELNDDIEEELKSYMKHTEFQITSDGFSLMNISVPYKTEAGQIAQLHVDDLEDEVYRNLNAVGISCDGATKTIKLYSDKVQFYKSNTQLADIYFDTANSLYRVGGFLVASDGLYTAKNSRQSTCITTDGFARFDGELNVGYGANIIGNGNDISLNASSGNKSVNIYGRNVNIGNGKSQDIFLNGDVSIASTSATVGDVVIGTPNGGKSVTLYGDAYGMQFSWSGIKYTVDGGTTWSSLLDSGGSIVGTVSWANITNKPSWIGSTKPSYTWSEISGKPSWIGSSKPTYSWSEISNTPTTMPCYYNLYWKYGTNNASFTPSAASGSYDGNGSNRFIAIPTASISGNTITINGQSLTVSSGDDVDFTHIDSNMIPNSGDTYDIGSSSKYWNRIYANYATVYNYLYMEMDGARISKSDTTGSWLYIGNDNNKGWVGLADCCSQSGSSKWKLETDGTGYIKTLQNGSDIRKKDVIEYIDPDVASVASAPLIRFKWKDDVKGRVYVGSIAQYWRNVLPDGIKEDDDGFLSMDYGATALVSSVVVARCVTKHERRIADLEREIERLKSSYNN